MATKNKAEHWRACAAEALAVSEEMTHPETKATMRSIAAGYQRMADQAEKHDKILQEILEAAEAAKARKS